METLLNKEEKLLTGQGKNTTCVGTEIRNSFIKGTSKKGVKMELEIYIRHPFSEYPIGIAEKRVSEMWEYEPNFPKRDKQRSGTDDSPMLRIEQIEEKVRGWKWRSEDFGALVYDPHTNYVLKVDFEAFEVIKEIQEGVSLNEYKERNKHKIQNFMNSLTDIYN